MAELTRRTFATAGAAGSRAAALAMPTANALDRRCG